MDLLNSEVMSIAAVQTRGLEHLETQEPRHGCGQVSTDLGLPNMNHSTDADANGDGIDKVRRIDDFMEMRQRMDAAYSALVEDGIIGAYCLKCGCDCGVHDVCYSTEFVANRIKCYMFWREKNHKHSHKGRFFYSSQNGICKLSHVPMVQHLVTAMEKAGLKVEQIQGRRRCLCLSLSGSLT